MSSIKITLNLPKLMMRELLARAASEGVSLDACVANIVRSALPRRVATRVVSKRSPVPVFHRAGAKPIPALSNAELYAVLDQQDAARYCRQAAT